MNRFSIAVVRVLISVLSLVLVGCTHAPMDVPSNAVPLALDEPAQPVNQHGGAQEYGERETSFDFNQATLNPQIISKLDEDAESLKKYPDLIVEISGHANPQENHSQQLSLRRARAAYEYLLSKDVDICQMLGPVGYGASRPVDVGDENPEHPSNRANRRVEVSVQNCSWDRSLCKLNCEPNSKN